MAEEDKGCLIAFIGIIIFTVVGYLLTEIINRAGDYIAILIIAAIAIPFIIFVIRCVIGMKK